MNLYNNQGVLGIQTNLVNLYTNNLQDIATQAALISGFAFAAVGLSVNNSADYDDSVSAPLDYCYYIAFSFCLCSSLFILTQGMKYI